MGGDNMISATVPTTFGYLSSMKHFSMWTATGSMPSQLGLWSAVTSLTLGGPNMMSATIPTTLGLLSNMEFFNMWAAGGTIPSQLGRWTSLTHLNLGGSMGGPLPTQLGHLQSLKDLNMWGFYSGEAFSIPSQLGLLSNLSAFSLTGSYWLQGGIPCEFGNLVSLQELSLSWNSLTGSLPEELNRLVVNGSLEVLQVAGNALSGEVSENRCLLLGEYDEESDQGLLFDCSPSSSGMCGCNWCKCIEGSKINATS